MHCSDHFTAIVNWRGTRFFYDGLGTTDKLRFRLESDNDYLNQEGSFAFYILLCNPKVLHFYHLLFNNINVIHVFA